jgi:hypothetical protein
MLKKEIACGPVYSIRVFQTGVCRIGGEYAYRHLDRDLDHAFTIYIAMIQGNGLTAIIDTGMASVDEMNRSDLLTYWLSIYP